MRLCTIFHLESFPQKTQNKNEVIPKTLVCSSVTASLFGTHYTLHIAARTQKDYRNLFPFFFYK